MNRRALLASIGGGTGGAFAGCLDHGSEGAGGGSPDDGGGNASPGTGSDETGGDRTEIDETDSPSGTNESDVTGGTNGTGGIDGNGDEASVPNPDGECGSEADPLSSVLLNGVDQNEGVCHEDLTPSFVVANERDDVVTAAVEIASEEEPIFEGSYSLEAGERAIEQDVGAAADLESVTVALEGGEEFSGEWADTVCYRHAAILAEEGLEMGYVSPLAGPGDTQHDCYAGDPVPIVLRSETAGTATVTVVDHCRESIGEETVELEKGGLERIEDALTNGGRYDVAVEVENGGLAVEEFRDACRRLSVSIDGEGNAEIGPVEMD